MAVVAHLEVGRVHTQSEGVRLTEGQKTSFQVVDFAHSESNSVHHSDAVFLGRGRGGGLVLPVSEVSLGLRVRCQHPGWRKQAMDQAVEMNQSWSRLHQWCSYLARASAPMSSALLPTLPQNSRTVSLSLAVRLVILALFDCC